MLKLKWRAIGILCAAVIVTGLALSLKSYRNHQAVEAHMAEIERIASRPLPPTFYNACSRAFVVMADQDKFDEMVKKGELKQDNRVGPMGPYSIWTKPCKDGKYKKVTIAY